MGITRRIVLLLAILAGALSARAGGGAALYRIVPIIPPSGVRFVSVNAITDDGAVVGTVSGEFGGSAFVWRGGEFEFLGTLPGGTTSSGLGALASGVVVGQASTQGFASHHPFLYNDRSGVMLDLGTLGGNVGSARAVNSSGRVVGNAQIENLEMRAFVWQGGVMTDLGVLPTGQDSRAFDINERGQVVGRSNRLVNGLQHIRPVLWEPDGTMIDLGGLAGGESGEARAINDAGVIVGRAPAPPASDRPFVWQDGVMTQLPAYPNAFLSWARDINNEGLIVGFSWGGPVGQSGILWENGELVDLNTRIPADSGVWIYDAFSINNAGWILVAAGGGDPYLPVYLLIPEDPCIADLDRNGQVGGGDLARLLQSWGAATRAPGADAADLNNDGAIDGSDLATLLGEWGPCGLKGAQ